VGVCEYWHAGQERWVLADAQIDERQRELFGTDFDVTDVPRDRFLVGGEAWARCRAGTEDPGKFGLSVTNEAGDWWIAANLMRTPRRWATSSCCRGTSGVRCRRRTLAELRSLCQNDDRLRVPPAVHNALCDRDEAI
jgi:hypothetical protein